MVFKDNAKKKNDDDCAHDSKESPDVFARKRRRTDVSLPSKGDDNKRRVIAGTRTLARRKKTKGSKRHRELKEKDDIFVTLKREEEEDVGRVRTRERRRRR